MATLVPPTSFFRIMPGFLGRRTPSAWHVLVRVEKQDVDQKKQDMLGWPDVISIYRGACGACSSDMNSEHEFRPVHDVPYKNICRECWPYLAQQVEESGDG